VNFSLEEKNELYPKIKTMALTDERSYVRAAALKLLAVAFADKDNSQVFKQAAADKAASVNAVLSVINKS
jgi:hypothetical protein